MRDIRIGLLKEKIYLMFDVESQFPTNGNFKTLERIMKMTISLIDELEKLTKEPTYLKTDRHLELERKFK